MAIRDWQPHKEQSLLDDPSEPSAGGGNTGNGHDRHIVLGKEGFYIYRDSIRFQLEWSGVYQIQKAELWVSPTTSSPHIGRGSAERFLVNRHTETWATGGGSEGHWSNSAPYEWPGAAVTAVGEGDSGSIGNPYYVAVDITEIVEAWAPETVRKRNGQPGGAEPNFGLRLRSFDEGDATRRFEGHGMRARDAGEDPNGGPRPLIRLQYIANHPPNPPIISSPDSSGGDAVTVGSYTGTVLALDWLFSDPDAGDRQRAVVLQVYSDAATDTSPGTLLHQRSGFAVPAPGLHHWVGSPSIPLTPRVNRRYRLVTQDDSGVTQSHWGTYTRLEDGRVFLAYKSRAPVALVMTTNPEDPHIFATIDSADTADYVTGAEPEAYRDTPQGTITLWAPGMVDIGGSSTRVDLDWAGEPLSVGDLVRWRIRLRGRDEVVGDFCAFQFTTMQSQTGPATMDPADTETKLLTRTPTFTIGHTASFDGYAWRIYRSGEVVHDSGTTSLTSTTSTSFAVPSGVLAFGDGVNNEMSWDAAIRLAGSGVLGAYSPKLLFRVDSLPSTTVAVSAD